MYTNKFKTTDSKTTKQFVAHDHWINMNALQTLAQAALETEAQTNQQEKTQQAAQQQLSWVKWPAMFKA